MRHSTSLKKKIRWRKTGLLIFGFFLLAGTAAAALVYRTLRDLPAPHRITERTIAQSTKIYDRTGTVLLYEIHGEEKRTVIPIRDIPTSVKLTALAAEDLYFYTHHGLDWRGIIRALIKNTLRGDITQGGSTITQQLVKKSFLTDERTWTRKLREAILAIAIERKYSKDEILELYLNQIPYGSNAYGIAAAAETFFSKQPRELTLAEAAILSALPKAPTYYSPYGSHREDLAHRKNWILDRMAEAGFAPPDEVKKAKQESVVFSPPKQSMRAPHFVLHVREYLNEKYGESFVERGGLKVTTTLDAKLQELAENAIKEGATKNEEVVGAYNAALAAIDPKTGEILSLVGSRDYWMAPKPKGCTPGVTCKFDPHVTVATRSRQPGSAFKPFVYATAFKKGFLPETVLMDVPTEFNPLCNANGTAGPLIRDPKSCYHPGNYDGKFRGPVSLRQALAQSLNLPSVKLLYLADIGAAIRTAADMGITTLTTPDRYGLSLVLGGAEVTLLEMTSAFGVFAQDGNLVDKTAILKIEDAKGTLIEERREIIQEPVLDPEVARTINSILSDNDARIPVFSPHSSLYFPNREVAAKTGTTQDFRDAWVVGYTPSLVAGVWVGNSDNSPMNKSAFSVMVAAPIWHQFLDGALKDAPAETFARPEPAGAEKPVLRGLYRSGEVIRIDKISGKLATPDTPPELVREVSTGEVKTILTYLDPNDPSGSPPADPTINTQFKNWQAGIDAWLSQNKIIADSIPAETDDLHTPEKRPHISFLRPEPTISSSRVDTIEITVKAIFPLREVILLINDALVESRTAPILSEAIIFSLPEALAPGVHKIKISAYDAVGNNTVEEREFTAL